MKLSGERNEDARRMAQYGLDAPKRRPVTTTAKPIALAATPITDPLLIAVENYDLAKVKSLLPSATSESVQAAKSRAQTKIDELNDADIFQTDKSATQAKNRHLGILRGITKALESIGKAKTPEVSLSEFSIFDSPTALSPTTPALQSIPTIPPASPSIASGIAAAATSITQHTALPKKSTDSPASPLPTPTQQSSALTTAGSGTTLPAPSSTSASFAPATAASSMPDTTGFDPSQPSYPSTMQSARPSQSQQSRTTYPWDIRDAETEANGSFKAARNVMIACFLLILIGLMAGGIPLIALAGLAVSGGFMAKYDNDMQTEKRQIAKQRNIQYGVAEEPVPYKAPTRQPQLTYDLPTPSPQAPSKAPNYHRDQLLSQRARPSSIDVGGSPGATAG